MQELEHNEIVFSFPDLNAGAILRIHFRAPDPADETRQPLTMVDRRIVLACPKRTVLHLRPNILRQDVHSELRYPFAVIISVNGLNALTGEVCDGMVRSPQNYLVTPPQGAIGGYFSQGQVHPFRALGMSPPNGTRLEIQVFPMSKQSFDGFVSQKIKCGYDGPVIRGMTLSHGGERQCEPIYEDMLSLGDWDRARGERAMIWLDGKQDELSEEANFKNMKRRTP